MIQLIRSHASERQIEEMLEALGTYIKLAVDTRREVLAGGGALHADYEAVLLEDGSRQEAVWGADWILGTQQVTFESLINIRLRQNLRWIYWILLSESVWQGSLNLYWVECE